MNTKPNIYDYVLSMFVAQDDFRPAMMKPFINDKHYCATNGHILCAVKKQNTGLKYSEDKDAPNAFKLIEDFVSDREVVVNRDEVMSEYFNSENQWKTKKLSCEKCKGNGYESCKCCGNESECNECDGTGSSDTDVPFSKITLQGEQINFLERKLTPSLFHIVILTAYILESKEIIVKYLECNPAKAIYFKIKECEILLMPRM
ncbi:hypothetical protein HZP37_13480 [Elizabethkingia anophelis]|nr:hypothetical protein [Elizabethkingia anophelis]MCT3874366.1 hypothetical protein [Elizabethkingia anophelis]MCT4152450.1 hypothetical protein [Elizabethkingia anophelis]MCT4252101.1 hypothetical protein [Elizabethkingia anophelis]